MTARDYGWVTLPSLALLLAAPVLESAMDSRQIPSALAAVALTWPVTAATLGWLRRLLRDKPRQAAIGFMAASLLRMVVAVGGAVLVATQTEWGRAAGFSFWIWIAVAYLSTLAAEVFVLAKPGWVGRGAGGRKG
jgi:hypothetical protein